MSNSKETRHSTTYRVFFILAISFMAVAGSFPNSVWPKLQSLSRVITFLFITILFVFFSRLHWQSLTIHGALTRGRASVYALNGTAFFVAALISSFVGFDKAMMDSHIGPFWFFLIPTSLFLGGINALCFFAIHSNTLYWILLIVTVVSTYLRIFI